MRRGKFIRHLLADEAHLLTPIKTSSKNFNRAILLLHGFSSSPAVYRKLIPKLSMYDAVYCPLLPGHGESIQGFSKISATDWLQASKKAFEELKTEYSTVDVMGLSLGGLLAYNLSLEVDIHHLYLLAPALVLHGPTNLQLHTAKILKFLKVFSLKNRAGNLCTTAEQELTYRRLPLNAIIEILSLIKSTRHFQPTCPTDVFLGKFDEVVNSNAVANIFQKQPNVTLHILKNSAHILPLEEDLDEIVTRLEKNT